MGTRAHTALLSLGKQERLLGLAVFYLAAINIQGVRCQAVNTLGEWGWEG